MRAEIAQLHRRLATTMIYVTHDQVEAMTMASKIVVLRGGNVEQVGAPLDLYNHPANQFVAGFIGSPRMNFLAGRVAEIAADGVAVDIPEVGRLHTAAAPQTVQVGDEVTLGIRPEHILAGADGGNTLCGEVAGVEQLGGLSYIRLAIPDVTAQLPGQTGLALGDAAAIHLPPDEIHVFDSAGLTLPRRTATPSRSA
jgi:ABC-type sugar transport system ATPase subunit